MIVKIGKNILKGIGRICAICFLALFLFLLACPIVNDLSAKGLQRDIRAIPLPEETEVVETFSRAGKLNGNGNGMQFLGCILVKSGLTLEELQEHYAPYGDSRYSCQVICQDTQDIEMIEHVDARLSTDVSEGGFYLIYRWGDGIPPFCEFDLRGH